MKKIIFLVLITFPVLLFGKTEFESYNWDTFSVAQNADTIKCVNGAAVMLERRIFETYLNAENYFEEIFVYHQKVKVGSHEGLASYNRIYISLDNVIEIINIQARFISPDGTITVLPKESIKEISNLDNKGDYKTFAIEGAEVGGQIEYFYVLRKKFDPYSGYYIQSQVPKCNVEIIFAYPSKVEYIVKGYNGIPLFTTDTSNPERTYKKAFISYIPSLEEERYASYKANLMRFEYTFSYNHYNSVLRKYAWKNGCENICNNIYGLSKDDKAAALSLFRQIAPEKGSPEQKIRAVENWIKTNISIKKEVPYQKDLDKVITLKQANNAVATKLFTGILLSGNIDFEFVETGNNITRPFDPDFNCLNFLNNYLIYFPDIDKYLISDDIDYRLGLIPVEYQGEYGLFMHPVSYNNDFVLAYCVRKIPVLNNSCNTDSLFIDVSLTDDQADIQAKIHREVTGELARGFQSLFPNLTGEKKKEVTGHFIRMGNQDSEISSLSVRNDERNDIGINPIIWDITMLSHGLVENAGNDFLIHIGETIGKQAELYQEKSRRLPVSVGILHSYFRRIVFHIPQGYTVANPEGINMDVAMKNGDKISCLFTSQARIEGDLLIVISNEYYTDESYPANRYNEFRDVINASADFNKKTILLKKI